MLFNEFTRRLEKCDFNNEAMFLLSHMFEVQVEFSKALDSTLTLMEKLTDRMQDVMHISNDIARDLKELRRRGIMDGVSVRSEPNEEN